jgi:hypothetical protein
MYQVKFKNKYFYKTLKKVVADGIVENAQCRFFILKSGERIEVPMTYIFWFSKERNEMMIKAEKQKAGLL